jgi:hypothetical protein
MLNTGVIDAGEFGEMCCGTGEALEAQMELVLVAQV